MWYAINRCMTIHRIPPKPEYFDTVPEGTCRWCNKEIGLTPKGRASKARWHPLCFSEYKFLFWPSTTRLVVWKRDNGRCATCNTVCDRKGANGWNMDHITPLIEANFDIQYWQLSNLQTLCKPCHKVKTSAEATERAVKRKELKK